MDHWRSHIPKNNPPKQFCEWSFELGDQKWQQNGQEHEFELRDDFFLEEDEVCGYWNKWSGPRGAHEAGGAPSTLMTKWWVPLVCSKCQKFLNILQKNHNQFSGHLENFYFRGIFIARIIQKIERKYYFCFIYSK